MSTVEVTIDLPFLLRLEDPIAARYEQVCAERSVAQLVGHDIQVGFSRRPAEAIDHSAGPEKERSSVTISADLPGILPEASVASFAIRDCLEIVNRVITAYQSVTGEVSNAGFISPVGTADMQLFAVIKLDGRDIRDRWPSHDLNTSPLPVEQTEEFKRYLTDPAALPLPKLFFTNALLALARGQYPLAVLQAAAAVELRTTAMISDKLRAAGWSAQAIKPYSDLTLGRKLELARTDPRSLGTYFHDAKGFDDLIAHTMTDVNRLRNMVAHDGYLPSHHEALTALELAHRFLRTITPT